MATIFHVDINAYFATMLQQENPALRGKPVGVVKSTGRTCVIASSKEAKKLGIQTGERLKDARQKAPNLIVVPAQFQIMLDATHKMKAVFQSFSPKVDIFSLDEAFLDLTDCELVVQQVTGLPYSNAALLAYAAAIQHSIQEALGSWVTCNVGIAHNKLLAKMASEVAPKGEVRMVTAKNLDHLLSTTRFADVCGVGYRLEQKLHALGVRTPYMINLLDEATLQQHFGPFWSTQLRLIGKGEDTHFFTHKKTVDHMQSVGRTITGYKPTTDETTIRRILLNLLEEATHKLRCMDLVGRKIGVSLSGNHQYWGRHRTLHSFVQHTDEIFPLLCEQLDQSWNQEFGVIKFGVWIGGLQPKRTVPLPLFPACQRQENVAQVIDAVNHRFGGFCLRRATLLGGPLIKPEVTGFLGDKTYLQL